MVTITKDLLTAKEVASLLHIDVLTIKRWARKGILPVIRINSRGDMRFRKEDIEAYLEKLKK